MSAHEYMGTMPGCWWPAVSVLVEPSRYLPQPETVLHGDPERERVAIAERLRRQREGDPFDGPAKVPEIINRECEVSEAPGTLPRLHARAVERGWRARVTHGRGWGVSRNKPGSRLVDSYALRLQGVDETGRDLRMFGLWVNGQAQYGGFLVVGSLPVHIGIEQLGELINSVRIRQSHVQA